MAHHQSIAKDANESYLGNRMTEAALLYRRAASSALDLGDRGAWFGHTVWAAQCATEAGDIPAALELLLSARQAEPEDAPEHESLMTRKLFIAIRLSTRPDLPFLRALLEDLDCYGASHTIPKGDLPEMRGDLLRACGDWSGAIEAYERAWGDYDGAGYIKSEKAYYAALCSLRIGKLAACKDWLKAMAGCDQKFAINTVWQSELAVRLALAEGTPMHEVKARLRTLQDSGAADPSASRVDVLRELAARVNLLDRAAGDPVARHHPARQELRRRSVARHDVSLRHSARLMYLDYRLASLRYAAGVQPVDDLYHNHPETPTARLTPSDPVLFAERLRKARTAARWALTYAEKVDTLLECDWRKREVHARTKRIDEIAYASGTLGV